MEGLLQELIGVLVWLVANGVYVDARRKGARGFHRFLAFWMGMPATLIWFITVPEGTAPRFAPPPDDDAALLAEVRRDRAERLGRGTDTPTDEQRADPTP